MRQDSETRREHLGTAWTAIVHGVKTLTWVRDGLSRPDETYGRSVSEGVKKSGHGRNILTNIDLEVYRPWKHSRSPQSACSYHGNS